MDTWAKVGAILCVHMCVFELFSLFTGISLPVCADRSPHSSHLYQIPSATSAVEVGRSMRNPGAGCHYGLCLCRARYTYTHTTSTLA